LKDEAVATIFDRDRSGQGVRQEKSLGNMSNERSLIILEDLFNITAIDPDGKKFDRVSRVKGTGENLGMDLILDVNSEIYPVKLGDRLNIALSKTINLDGTPSDEGSYRPDATGPTLADKYEYVMYGRLFKFENTSNPNKMYCIHARS
jgi:DNA-directed RNA polymerases I, II, and III subunit RPABC3